MRLRHPMSPDAPESVILLTVLMMYSSVLGFLGFCVWLIANHLTIGIALILVPFVAACIRVAVYMTKGR